MKLFLLKLLSYIFNHFSSKSCWLCSVSVLMYFLIITDIAKACRKYHVNTYILGYYFETLQNVWICHGEEHYLSLFKSKNKNTSTLKQFKQVYKINGNKKWDTCVKSGHRPWCGQICWRIIKRGECQVNSEGNKIALFQYCSLFLRDSYSPFTYK